MQRTDAIQSPRAPSTPAQRNIPQSHTLVSLQEVRLTSDPACAACAARLLGGAVQGGGGVARGSPMCSKTAQKHGSGGWCVDRCRNSNSKYKRNMDRLRPMHRSIDDDHVRMRACSARRQGKSFPRVLTQPHRSSTSYRGLIWPTAPTGGDDATHITRPPDYHKISTSGRRPRPETLASF
jgi:hypothetical protein